jgi:two-component system NtrC family sensor kinase
MEILVAEDHPVTRRIIQKILESSGYKALLAEDGLKAWELLQTNNIKMVITDWMMPQMDGLTLCRKIRGAKLPNYVYLILLTFKDQKEDSVKGLEAGADDYIAKPVHRHELIARIRSGERIIQLEEGQKKTHTQLLQSEKMASVGQLAAGVAHEINNPTGFVSSNLNTLKDYQDDIDRLLRRYKALIADLKETIAKRDLPPAITEQVEQIVALETEIDVDFIMDDIPNLIGDCREGTERIRKIVLALKDFAHPGEDKPQLADINKGLESTLNVVWNELKYKAKVTKDYSELPPVRCYPQQLNQVFMNILVNAAQAIDKEGLIKIATSATDGYVQVRISDTGSGIPKELRTRIFDPFFTTKDVGKGTGLGLNVAYNIVKKHNGSIDVESEVGKGTTFIIRIPVDGMIEDEN